jgi:DNA polymerase elongation subunit (family B)
MQIEAQDYLNMVEATNQICFFDIEATGLRGDYNSVLVVSVRPFKGKVATVQVSKVGDDKAVLKEAWDLLSAFHCWVSYYGKGFDVKMLNTRLLNHGMPILPARHHLDMYWSLKGKLLTARRSQGHLGTWLGLPEAKMAVSAKCWAEAHKWETHSKKMVKRCESDTKGLRELYKATRHLVKNIACV